MLVFPHEKFIFESHKDYEKKKTLPFFQEKNPEFLKDSVWKLKSWLFKHLSSNPLKFKTQHLKLS